MAEYLVEWVIDGGDAETPMEAAEFALETMREVCSLATVFTVTDVENGGQKYVVDLTERTVEVR